MVHLPKQPKYAPAFAIHDRCEDPEGPEELDCKGSSPLGAMAMVGCAAANDRHCSLGKAMSR